MSDDHESTQDGPPPQAASGQKPPAHAPDAIVYVPGLQLGLYDQRTFLGIAQKIARACDRHAEKRSSTWSIESHPADLGSDHPDLQKTTVIETDGDASRPALDLYEFPWARQMTERWEARGVGARATRGVVGFYYGVKLLVVLARRKGEKFSWRRMWQALIALVFLLIVLAYLLGVLVAAATVAWVDEGRLRLLQQVALVITGVVTFVFPALSKKIPVVGASLLATSDYIRLPPEPQRIAGELTSMIESIAESGRHARIHVVGYSMGGIVAFDAMFPSTAPPARSLGDVESLVTIGAPFSTVRATRGTYFDGRKPGDPPTKWINYWAEADVLSAKRPLLKSAEPFDPGGQRLSVTGYDLPVHLGLPNMLVLYGFSSHELYWGPDGERENNIFDLVVRDLELVDPERDAARQEPTG